MPVMMTHICADINGAIRDLKRGRNVWNASPGRVLVELTRAKAEGKRYYSGCSRMGRDGRCRGHVVPTDADGKPFRNGCLLSVDGRLVGKAVCDEDGDEWAIVDPLTGKRLDINPEQARVYGQ